MLNKIRLRNFRAFKDQQFEFSKINVFVGPNNSGKSSAISAINLLAQTMMFGPQGRDSPLILNGQFEQLGTFIDTVHGNRSNTPLGIDFGFGRYDVSLDLKLRSQRREIELSKFELQEDRKSVIQYATRSNSFHLKLGGKASEDYFPEHTKRRPRFVGFWPFPQELSRLRMAHREEESTSINSEIRESLSKVETQTRRAFSRLNSMFRDFDSLGPFRDQPSRTYLYTGEVASHVGQTGSNSMTLLLSDASRRGAQKVGFVDGFSRWLKVTGIGQGIAVKNLTPRHCEICVIGNDGVEHNICDVGFGCSQVLPVIVGAMNLFGRIDQPFRRNPIYVVQEPEIHLHPNAQAALGSLFVGLARQSGQIFIETHSDNLVLRLARHVAMGDLASGDVSVFLVSDDCGQKRVKVVRPQADGAFDPEWPGGFFPQRQSESLALAKAGIGRKKGDDERQLEFFYPEER